MCNYTSDYENDRYIIKVYEKCSLWVMGISFSNCKFVQGFRTMFSQYSVFLFVTMTHLNRSCFSLTGIWKNVRELLFEMERKESFLLVFFCWQCSNPPSFLQQGSPGSSFSHWPAQCIICSTAVRPAGFILLQMMSVLNSRCPRKLNIPAHCCPTQLAVPRPCAGQETRAAGTPVPTKKWMKMVLCLVLQYFIPSKLMDRFLNSSALYFSARSIFYSHLFGVGDLGKLLFKGKKTQACRNLITRNDTNSNTINMQLWQTSDTGASEVVVTPFFGDSLFQLLWWPPATQSHQWVPARPAQQGQCWCPCCLSQEWLSRALRVPRAHPALWEGIFTLFIFLL